MKRILLALFLCASSYSVYSQNQIPLPTFHYTPLDTQGRVIKTSVLNDGKYEAKVQYSNSSTGTKSTYSLQVSITDDRVVAIYFPNGGYIHTGKNNNGYTYSGGVLDFYTDDFGNLDSADTTVRISENESYTYYKVEL